ncbi:PilW family protein [Vibrio algivorus]|uniref:MSHA biogenesis protein MshO n=1 Tax=Vibrio algivorus TaxID=1667024 RepID=A0ABQ6EQ50_9VIBR|nr:type II secretion system protein [Vibrio algivorus]GLT15062.1 MSHA biogenesis protein MshO [Vibrio algivorus]
MAKMKKQSGFTLIELIITIVAIGIMVMGITGFIELGTKGYADTVDRQQLQNQARFVVEKLTREIRHAVPNSFSVTNNDTCLSFYPIEYSGGYAVLEQNDDSINDRFRFVVVNTNSSPEGTVLQGNNMVINPATPEDLEPTNSTQSIVLSSVTKNDDNIYSIAFDDDFNASNVVASPANRLYIYNHKVTYCQEGTRLTREVDTNGAIQVGENVETAYFADGTGGADGENSLSRSALIHFQLRFKRGDEVSNYENDVQVMNVP